MVLDSRNAYKCTKCYKQYLVSSSLNWKINDKYVCKECYEKFYSPSDPLKDKFSNELKCYKCYKGINITIDGECICDDCYLKHLKEEQEREEIKKKYSSERPPLGIIPRDIAIDKFNIERLQKLYEAIMRYIMASKEVPEAWVNEFNEIVKNFNHRS